MGADFSRVRLNPLLDYAGVELKQGRVAARCATSTSSSAIIDRRLRALGQRRPRPRDGIVHHARCLQDQRRGRHAADRQGPPLCRRPARREPWAKSDDPAKRVFDGLLAESQFRRSDPLRRRSPICPLPRPADGRTSPGLSRCVGSRGHASRAPRSGRERGRRRDELAPSDGLAGARARRRRRHSHVRDRPTPTCPAGAR